jgi:hypothetical protein
MGFLRVLGAAFAAYFFVASAAAESSAVLATTDSAASALQPSASGLKPQSTQVSVIGPIEEELVELKGHQAADRAIMAAVEIGTSEQIADSAPLPPPEPTLFADVNLTTQRLTLSDRSGVLHKWKISSAGGGYVTPVGVYKPQWTSRMHYSKQYYNHKGYAVHGTRAVGRLGRPASHGCVRLRTSNAKKFYNAVNKHGKGLTKITVRGTPPPSPRVRDRRPRRYQAPPSYQPFGFFSAYSYQPPRKRRRRYRRRRYSSGY